MLENIRLAFQGIWSHMMRSFLTMLGIIIGIASIIAIVSTIKGTSEQIKEDLIGAGSNTVNIYLYDGDNQYDAEYGNSSKAPILTDDVKEEVKDLDHVENATFYYNSTSASIYNNNNSLEGGSVYGIDVNYLATCGYIIQSGRGFVKDDYKNYNKVALIDDNAAQNLFPSQNPVGQTVEINQEPYTIVGVIRQDENYQPTINSIDEYYTYYQSIVGSVMIPDSCWPISFKFDVPQNVIVKADSTDTMSTVGNAAADALNNLIAALNTGGNTTMKYKAEDIMEQVKNMLPIIIALMFLAVLTIVSCTSILVRQSLYKYGVFYLNGLTWKECMRLQKTSIFILETWSLVVVWAALEVMLFCGQLREMVVIFTLWEFAGCLLILGVFWLFGDITIRQEIGKKSGKDVLTESGITG